MGKKGGGGKGERWSRKGKFGWGKIAGKVFSRIKDDFDKRPVVEIPPV